MEALAVVQTVSSIVQLVEFGSRCLKESLEFYHKSSGALDENLAIEATATRLSNLNNAVTASALTLTDASLKDLCDQITPTAEELLDALEKLKVQGARTRWKCMRKAIESVWGKKKLYAIENKLAGFRDELDSHIGVSTRNKLESLDADIIARFHDCDTRTREILDAIRNSSDLFQTALNDHSVLLQGLEEEIRKSLQTSQAVIQQDIRDTASHTETVIQGQHSKTQLAVREEIDRVLEGNAGFVRTLELRVQSIIDSSREDNERMHQQTQKEVADLLERFAERMQQQHADHLKQFDPSSQTKIIDLFKQVVQMIGKWIENEQEIGQALRETTPNSEHLRQRCEAATASILAQKTMIADAQESLLAFKVDIVDLTQWMRAWSVSEKTAANVSIGLKFEAYRQVNAQRMNADYFYRLPSYYRLVNVLL